MKNWASLLLKHRKLYFNKNVISAANAGQVDVGLVNVGDVMIKSIVVRANSAITANWTSATITSGPSADPTKVTHLKTTVLKLSNVATEGQQVSWTGAVKLKATDKVVMTLNGTGAAAVDFDVDVEFEPIIGNAGIE